MTALNDRAWHLVDDMIAEAEYLGVNVQLRAIGTRVLDAGVNCPGSLGAGIALARICTAGMGDFRLQMADLSGHPWLWIVATSDQPWIGCYLCQAAHWQVKLGAFHAMGSGPACLLNQSLAVGAPFKFEDISNHAVLILETRELPGDHICQELADACGVAPNQLSLIVAPTACLAGSAQIASRSIETALHKLHHIGFDVRQIVSATARCPVALPTNDDLTSMATTNDLVIFASQVWLGIVGIPDEQLARLALKMPAGASPDYGESFAKILSQAGNFYDIDPGLFAPAEITLSNLDTGRSFHAGVINERMIRRVLDVHHHN